MVTTFKYKLQPYKGRRTRHTCPGCGKAYQFTRYIEKETGQEIAPHVGKCNRLDKCGYHYTVSQFFRDNPQARENPRAFLDSKEHLKTYKPPTPPQVKETPPAFIPREAMERTRKAYRQNNFIRYLATLFGWEKALSLAQRFHLGTSKHWRNAGGFAVVFWQVDAGGNIRQAKVMAYNPTTGRRLKDEDAAEKWIKGQYRPDIGKGAKVYFAGRALAGKDANLVQCFFGEHQLPQYPAAPVAIVESEKTAVIMAGIMPHVVWLATGGKNGARWTEKAVYSALEGRTVILYPDLGAFDEWRENGKILGTVCDVSTSELLELKAAPEDRAQGFDIADYFTKQRPENAAQDAPPAPMPVQAQQTALSDAAPQSETRPQDATGQPEGITAPQDEENSPQGPETAQELVLPPGVTVTEWNGHKVVDVDGLWLGIWPKEELPAALERMAGHELAIMTALNPLVSELVERFGLAAEGPPSG